MNIVAGTPFLVNDPKSSFYLGFFLSEMKANKSIFFAYNLQ